MKYYYKLIALLPALAILFSLAACGSGADAPTDGPVQEATETVSPTQDTVSPTQEPSDGPTNTSGLEPAIRLAVLSGPTGIGAARLLDRADNDPVALRAGYTYDIYTEETMDMLEAGLIQGELDIATMASNEAAKLYNKNDGDVQIIAAGTLGVLHILEGSGGDSIHSVEDLRGKTIWSAGQGKNPEYILRYLLQESGLKVGTDVEVVFAPAPEIQTKLLDGQIQYAMLPVPAATAAIAKGAGQVRAAIDVTEAWGALQGGSRLVMTAVVARAKFVEEHPELVDAFLADYEASISFVNSNIDAAAELVAGYGIAPNAAIAKQAIPQCHLVFLSGNEMLSALSDYFLTLYAIDPASVGGSVPDDGVYWQAGCGMPD